MSACQFVETLHDRGDNHSTRIFSHSVFPVRLGHARTSDPFCLASSSARMNIRVAMEGAANPPALPRLIPRHEVADALHTEPQRSGGLRLAVAHFLQSLAELRLQGVPRCDVRVGCSGLALVNRICALFAVQNRLQTLFDELAAYPPDHRLIGVERFDDLAIALALAKFKFICFKQYHGFQKQL